MKLKTIYESPIKWADNPDAARKLAWHNAPESVPECVYRGISDGEWQSIATTGVIQSDGRHLYPEQRGWTPFGSIADAIHYGIEVPTWNGVSKATAYIIEVPKSIILNHSQDDRVFSGEYAHYGPLDASFIRRAWFAVATGGETRTIHNNGNVMGFVNCTFRQIRIQFS